MDPIERLRAHQPELRDNFKVARIGVFGSFARREDQDSSDVDILVEFSQSVGLFHFIDLQDRLAEIMERKVDLVTKDGLHPIIREQILNEVVYI